MSPTLPIGFSTSTAAALALCCVAACGAFAASGESGSAGTPDGSVESGADGAVIDASSPDSPACNGADLASDTKNCGACGHACAFGSCMGGLCQAVPLVEGRPVLGDIVTDGLHVYWAESGALVRCSVSGCASPEPVATTTFATSSPATLALGPAKIFWVDGTTKSVLSCPLAGACAPSAVLSVGSGAPLVSLTASAVSVFAGQPGAQSLLQAPLDGGAPSTAFGSGAFPWRLANRGGVVVWADLGGGDGNQPGHWITKFIEPAWIGGPPFAQVQLLDRPMAVAAGASGTIYSLGSPPVNGPKPQLHRHAVADLQDKGTIEVPGVVAPTAFALALAPDSTADVLYGALGDGSGGIVFEYRSDTGALRVLATGLASPHGIAVDAQSVYFTQVNGASGSVMRIAR